jgi:hypothetical protein
MRVSVGVGVLALYRRHPARDVPSTAEDGCATVQNGC